MGTSEEEMIGVFADWHNNDKTDLRSERSLVV
jgi:hypothetical protein